jgi:hypothetical protein
MKVPPSYKIEVPRTYNPLSSFRSARSETVRVKPSGKPPKLRFKPGEHVKYEGTDHVVLYAFRIKDEPHEWLFCVAEERRPRSSTGKAIDTYLETLGAGSRVPRVMYELFVDKSEAYTFFSDIPRMSDQAIVSNKVLLKENPRG